MGFYDRACRSLAERKSVEVSEVVAETDVSGGTSVADRALDGLIKKVEAGKLAGINGDDLDGSSFGVRVPDARC